MKREKLRV